uniref:Uncharacterized protein n=1 Tax=Rhizophora mucronata TaxID=61149 RepID=A0A2P2NTL7_RHIMU
MQIECHWFVLNANSMIRPGFSSCGYNLLHNTSIVIAV